MNLGKSVFIVVIILLIGMMSVSAVQAADTAKPYGDIVVQSFLGGLQWRAGIVYSISNPDAKGLVLKASRTIYTVKMNESKSLDINGDLFAVKAQNNEYDALGLGFSLGTSKYIGFDIGIGYLSAGYKWTVTATPWSMKL